MELGKTYQKSDGNFVTIYRVVTYVDPLTQETLLEYVDNNGDRYNQNGESVTGFGKQILTEG